MSFRTDLQAALMAPTEILAAQHYESLSALLAPCGIASALITGSMRARRRGAKPLQGLKSGGIQLAVGTHALISDGVEFSSGSRSSSPTSSTASACQSAHRARQKGQLPAHARHERYTDPAHASR
jgi:hypothetical protein